MNVKIQSLKFDADQKLIDFIENKLAKLDKLADGIIAADVTLKLDKDNEHGNKIVVIALDIPGDKLVAEKQCKSFEEAIDLSIDALKKQISRHKEIK
ncbi:MAG: ribosome-associated translation inhibitor RaiA [Rikenellaceae bacterium]